MIRSDDVDCRLFDWPDSWLNRRGREVFYVDNHFNYLRIIFIDLLFFGAIRNSMLFIGITVDYLNCELLEDVFDEDIY